MRQGQQHKNHSDAYSADTKYSQERYNAEGYRTANTLLFLRTMKRKEEVTKQVFSTISVTINQMCRAMDKYTIL